MANRTLLLNLTRFGDLLQTQPVISGLARRGEKVELLCQENFAGTAELLTDLDAVRALPGARLLARLDDNWRLALAELHAFKRQALAGRPDRVLNLTATLAARVLSRHLAGEAELDGFGLDQHGFSLSGNSWAALLIASTRHRGLSPFNLVDLFWKASGLPDEPRPNRLARPSAEAVEEARQRLAALAPEGAGFLALQLGASENRRRYPIKGFARAAAELARTEGLTPALFGGGGEKPLAERFREAYPADLPLADLTGATTLPQLAASLLCCRLLLTNDTGTMHLAAGLGLPIAAVFLATAQPWDTGPYLPGSLCLEPDTPCHPCPFGQPCPHGEACRQAIPPATLAAMARRLLEAHGDPGEERLRRPEGMIPSGLPIGSAMLGPSEIAWPEHGRPDGEVWGGSFPPAAGGMLPQDAAAPADMAGARVWRSVVGDDHFLDLVSLSGHECEDRTRWVRLQRRFYRQFLDGGAIAPPPADSLAPLSPAFVAPARELLRESSQLLTLLESQARVLAMAPREAVRTKFLAVWQRLQTLWDASPRFFVLGYLFLVQFQEQQQDAEGLTRLLGRYHTLVDAWLAALPSD